MQQLEAITGSNGIRSSVADLAIAEVVLKG
jgi:hypothetical protein